MPISSELQDRPAPWEPSQQDVDEKAWKYAGYRSFCEFISSDEDFFVLRRFGSLTARVLLNLQDQLARLEEELEAIEQQLRQRDVPDVHNGSFRHDTQEQRKKKTTEAQHVLREYSKRPNPFYIPVILKFTFVSTFWTKTSGRRPSPPAFPAQSATQGTKKGCYQPGELVLQSPKRHPSAGKRVHQPPFRSFHPCSSFKEPTSIGP